MRIVIEITGADRVHFLQGLVTKNVEAQGLIYTALLTPQGKLIGDFFLLIEADHILLDAPADNAPTLFQRLSMYRLRADVSLKESAVIVSRGTGNIPAGAHADPRDPALGWRKYGDTDISDDTDWDALRVAHMIPEWGAELSADSYILEMDFERLNGVDFKKGCYVGQEVTARMKHKTELRKGLAKVGINGSESGEITADGRAVGQLYTRSGNAALAYLRFGRAQGDMQVGEATRVIYPAPD